MASSGSSPVSSRREVLVAGVSLTGFGVASLIGGRARAESRVEAGSVQAADANDDDLLDRAFERIATRERIPSSPRRSSTTPSRAAERTRSS